MIKRFRYSPTDTSGVTHTTGTFTNNTQTRSTLLPRFDVIIIVVTSLYTELKQ